MVRVRIPATDKFKSVTCEDTFTISYLPTPSTTHSLSGTKGKNDYYVSEVFVVAPNSYSIGRKVLGDFYSQIQYSDDFKSFCLRRDSDGAMTDKIDFTEALKIDTELPEIEGTVPSSGNTTYADTLAFAFKDEHLANVTVNDEDVSIANGKAAIELDSDNGIMDFTVVAEDEAGNTSTYKLTMKATWLIDKKIPIGARVKLEAGEAYNLESGIWTVNTDTTIYHGGGVFYVYSPGDYTFTKK